MENSNDNIKNNESIRLLDRKIAHWLKTITIEPKLKDHAEMCIKGLEEAKERLIETIDNIKNNG